MQTNLRNLMKIALVVLLLAAIWMGGAGSASAVSLPASPCVSASGATTCELFATTGTATLFGTTSVNIWGYSATSTTGSASLPGPILIVNQGDTVTVTLHNNLTETTSLNFEGQSVAPDTSGVAAGGTRSYTFTANRPGTFLYEAGLIPGLQHQIGLGMYGALVVKPSDGTAYGSPATAYDEETVLVLSEIDPALNSNPAGFDMRNFAPRYFLINGKAYAAPFTGDIPVTAGNRVLLRYVNAGQQSHAMSTLGTYQSVIAMDGYALTHPHSMISETIATGQTLDVLVTIPASTTNGTRFAVFDGNLMLRNSAASGFGGMLTFLTAGAATPPAGDTTGPSVSLAGLTPNPTDGSVAVNVSATASDVSSGNHNVTQAEFYIDSTSGSPTAMSGSFGAPSVTVSGSIPTTTLTGLASGNHTVYIRGRDDSPDTPGGNWGPFLPLTLVLDKSGPTTSSLSLTPNPSTGAESVALAATGNDSASGNSNVTTAEYRVDGGAPTAMTASGSASPIRSFSATIPSGLSMGSHIVSVRSQDAFGNWGAAATINLMVGDTAAPTTSAVSASPNPNNGSNPLSTSVQAVRVTASFSDVATGNSNIAAAEGFIDTIGTTGTGFAFIANDGTFNSPAEAGYSDIPLVVVGALANGNHTISVHARDAAGNWGSMTTTTLVIDKAAPTVSGVTLAPAATNNTAVLVSATASDAATGNSNIIAGEYFIDTAGAAGTGTQMTPAAVSPSTAISATIPAGTVAALTAGSHTILVRARDAAGNWSATASAALLIDRTAPTFSGITLTPNSITAGTASVTLNISGSSDGAGGSGVAGGEWWICPAACTNPAAGSGTAFNGLSASIPTALLSGGHQYTVRARIRDVAGNWSSGTNGVRSAALTVTPANNIFTNGFEAGNFSGWSSRSTTNTTRLNVTTGAALFGAFGLQAQGNNTNYVQNNISPAAGTYDARFYFNPNNNASSGQDIFAAATSNTFGGTTLFHVRYRRNGTQPQVQIQVGTTANAAWVNITNNTSNTIEVVWQSGSTLQLYVNGTLSQTLTASSGNVASVRLGSVTSGGSSTQERFDAFTSKSSVSPLLGP